MPRYFPSKKVFVVGVLALALLAWAIVGTGTTQQLSEKTNSAFRSVAQAGLDFPDSDNDGLYDWEEQFYGTDPFTGDSDGNGVSDGEQYKQSKDYADVDVVPYDEQFGVSRDVQVLNIDENNLTQMLLSQSLVDFTSLNGNVSSAEEEDIINSLTEQIPQFEYDIIYDDSFITTAPHTNEALQQYIISFADAMEANETIYKLDTFDILETWGDRSEEDNQEVLDAIAYFNERLSQQLVETPTPHELVEHQVALANIFHNNALIALEVKSHGSDPAKTIGLAATQAQLISHRTSIMQDLFSILVELDHHYAGE